MKSIFVVGFCGMVALLTGCSWERPEQALADADGAFQAGRYAEAITRYEKLEKLVGGSANLYYNMALAGYHVGDFPYVTKQLNNALNLDKSHFLSLELQAMVALEKSDTRAGLQQLWGLIAQAPDGVARARIRARLASYYVGKKRPRAAQALLLGARQDQPEQATTIFNLAKLAKDELELYPQALAFYEQAKKKLPAQAKEMKETTQAISQLTGYLERLAARQQAGAGDQATCEKQLALGKKAVEKRDWASAEKVYTAAMKADASNSEAAMLLGSVCDARGKTKSAYAAYQKAYDLQGLSAEKVFRLAELAWQLKDYSAAEKYLGAVTMWSTLHTREVDLMVRVLVGQKRLADARQWGELYVQLAKPGKHRDDYLRYVSSLPLE